MAVRADLRAASDERVRVDHGAVADPGACVDVHGRHAGDALAEIRAIADTRTARNDTHACSGRDASDGIRRFVEPGLALGIDRHIHDGAHAEAEQNAFLYPGVHAPAGLCRLVRLSRANLAAVQRALEGLEKLEVLGGVSGWFVVKKLLDLSLHARSGWRACRVIREPSRSSLDSLRLAGTSGGARRARAAPSSPWWLSPESGSIRRSSLP